jgi:hypothetical protein
MSLLPDRHRLPADGGPDPARRPEPVWVQDVRVMHRTGVVTVSGGILRCAPPRPGGNSFGPAAATTPRATSQSRWNALRPNHSPASVPPAARPSSRTACGRPGRTLGRHSLRPAR